MMDRSNHKSEIINHKSTAFSLLALVAMSAAAARAIADENFGTGRHFVQAINDGCIMAGSAEHVAGNNFMKYYDGYKWKDYYSDLKNFTGCTVRFKDKKPGDYWLLPGASRDDGSPWKYALNKWDGTTFTDLKGNLIGFSGNRVDIVRWGSCGHWLIAGAANYYSKPKLNKYDGTTWTDLSSHIADQNYGITKMLYSGTYWLIVGNGGWVKKYDGAATWTNVSTGWGVGQGLDIDALGWNGSYWLAGNWQGKVGRYDGATWTDLSSAAGFTSGKCVFGINWSPTLNYWLVGSEGNPAMLKEYDGASWTSVSEWSTSWRINTIDWTGTTFVIGYYDASDGYKCKIASYDGTTLIQGVKVVPEPGGITLVVCAAIAGLIRLLWNRKKG
ncbi:MAG: hypothetical protein KKA28_15725 [Planctomycetes bacterium]|nr:hypothetical protein [Planctomycetota bacterium]MCG2685736.1 hypothetical protein [Planctomycetales bacterium]